MLYIIYKYFYFFVSPCHKNISICKKNTDVLAPRYKYRMKNRDDKENYIFCSLRLRRKNKRTNGDNNAIPSRTGRNQYIPI